MRSAVLRGELPVSETVSSLGELEELEELEELDE